MTVTAKDMAIPDQKTPRRNQRDYAFNTLHRFLTSVIERQVLVGEPRDYDRMHNYLKIITDIIIREQARIPTITSPAKRKEVESMCTDANLRLAVEGGDYCGPGKFEVAESVYASFIGEAADIPIQMKMLNCLQDARNYWFQEFYNKVIEQNANGPYSALVDLHDIHIYNQVINLYGSELGLRAAGAANDATAVIDPVTKVGVSWIVTLFQGMFWEEYT